MCVPCTHCCQVKCIDVVYPWLLMNCCVICNDVGRYYLVDVGYTLQAGYMVPFCGDTKGPTSREYVCVG